MPDTAAWPVRLPALDAYRDIRTGREGVVDRFGRALGAWWVRGGNRRRRRQLARLVQEAGIHSGRLSAASDAELKAELAALTPRLRRADGFPIAETGLAFAILREVSERVIGQRPYDVQLAGAFGLLNGTVSEMQTGEGKTLTAALAAATAALAGLPVHVVTVNDYLAQRDAEFLTSLYRFAGLSVGLALASQSPDERRHAYRADITYCTNKTLTFDYLRDQIRLQFRGNPIRLRLEGLYGEQGEVPQLLLRGLHFAIVDEADSILIDEARTPLLISEQVERAFDSETLERALHIARALIPDQDYRLLPELRRVELTPAGEAQLEQLVDGLEGNWTITAWRRELTLTALSALRLFHRDEHYLVDAAGVHIVDESTGRIMPDRFWHEPLHQLIELKEGSPLSDGRTTIARMSYQKFFRRYALLAGMTGTARDVELELWRVYGLPVTRLPTHRPCQRLNLGEQLYPTEDEKWRAVADRAAALQRQGRAVLIGTRTVGASRRAAEQLDRLGLDYRLLNASQDREEAEIIAGAGRPGRITLATNMAGRGTDILPADPVLERGGLHIILSERHESARIDKQLQGRCARQGQPGSYEAILSLDDLLLGARKGRGLDWLRRSPPLLRNVLGTALIRHAQRQTERRHGRLRWRVLRADDELDDLLAFAGRSE
ncbi:MAG: prepilin peptidase [Oceanospirillaceae bacterium]|nr:prepilin peptidase [Oceanospirillaceae bacterium]